MGLDTTHDCWHGSYSSFNEWRREIEKASGFEDVDYQAYEWFNFQGMWESATPSDGILILLVHSDCDGYIFPGDQERLADRLEELLPALDASGPQYSWSPRGLAERFIAGLRDAIEKIEVVQFR